ncbi:interleukin-27 subunit alpha-like isoform X2 [Heterodontus francisci]|uniref:interleukin-27 subunit alpha-like isoform X2 n=1 Tax=Heterodontus francisci TaxID=7792 RepID=UPI00355C03A2
MEAAVQARPPTRPTWERQGTPSLNMEEAFTASLKLSRTILRETRKLQLRIGALFLPGVMLDERSELKFLPPWTMTHSHWISLQDSVRLLGMAESLPVFQAVLRRMRTRERRSRNHSKILQAIDTILMETRDLIWQIHSEMTALGISIPESRGTWQSLLLVNHSVEWDMLTEGLLLLQAWSTYLGRVVRDFSVLRARAGG